jgi:heme-degrading monooxygenase HmoA
VIELVFVYDTGNADEFEAAYGATGDWSQFFQAGRGYVGTELLKDLEQPGRYVVIDRWESREAYNEFVAEHREEYVRRVDETAFLYDRELRFGTFETVWSD